MPEQARLSVPRAQWLFHFSGRGADIEHLGYMTVMRLFRNGG